MNTDHNNDSPEQRVPPVQPPSANEPTNPSVEALPKMNAGLKTASAGIPSKAWIGGGMLVGFLVQRIPQPKDALTQLQEALVPRDTVSQILPVLLYMAIGAAVGYGISVMLAKK